MQPGETITPNSAPAPEQLQQPEVPQPAPVEQPPAPAPEAPVQTSPSVVTELPADGPEPSSPYEAPAVPEQNMQSVSWTASEYIAHNKGTAWFVALGLGLFAASAVIYLFTRDIFTALAIAVAGITFGVFAARAPRTLEYAIDDEGIHIGQKLYPYNVFKSFDVTEEGSLPAIQLMPLKRFMPPLTVFYDVAQEDVVIGALTTYLPHQEHQPDAVDRLARRIRF